MKKARASKKEEEIVFGIPINKYTASVAACLVIAACIYVSADFSNVSGYAVQPSDYDVFQGDGICELEAENDPDCLCSAQSGIICGSEEYCAQWIYASDTWDCCKKCLRLKTCAEQNGRVCSQYEHCELYYGALDRNDCCALCLPK